MSIHEKRVALMNGHRFAEAEPLVLAATAENDDFGDNIVLKAEFYEAWGDHLAPEALAAEKYALSHAEWAWFAACSTSGGEGTARMLAVNRVRQKLADLINKTTMMS